MSDTERIVRQFCQAAKFGCASVQRCLEVAVVIAHRQEAPQLLEESAELVEYYSEALGAPASDVLIQSPWFSEELMP